MPKRHSGGENGSRDLPEFATPGALWEKGVAFKQWF